MGYDLQRAGVTLLCVVSLLLAASLFPATGFGEYQGWSPAGVGADDGGSGVAGPGGPGQGSDGTGTGGGQATTTTTADGGDGGTTTTTSDEGSTTTGDGETTTTTTGDGETTTTTTTASGPAEDDRSGGGPFSTVGSLLAGVLYVLVMAVGVVLVGGALFSVASLVGLVSTRRPDSNRLVVDVWMLPEFSIPVRSGVVGVPQMTTAFLVGIGNSLPAVLDDFADLGSGLTTGVGTLFTGIGRGATQLFVGVPKGLGSALSGAGSVLGGSLLAVPDGLSGVGKGLLNPFGDDGPLPGSDARDVAGTPNAGDDDEEVEDLPPQSVEEAWSEMVAALPVRNRDAKTPAELARIAVGRGLPKEPVGQLTAAFREVRYGGRGAGEAYLDVARAAVRRIQDDAEGE